MLGLSLDGDGQQTGFGFGYAAQRAGEPSLRLVQQNSISSLSSACWWHLLAHSTEMLTAPP